MKLMGEAVDAVRRAESKDRPELKKTRWSWQRNPENLRADQHERLRVLQGLNLDTATAYQMRLSLQDFYEQPNPRAAAGFLADWCELAKSTGLEPVMKLAQTLTEHANGVLRWFSSRITNGLLEGIKRLSRPRKPMRKATAPLGTSSPSPTSSPASSTSLRRGPDRATHTVQRGTKKASSADDMNPR